MKGAAVPNSVVRNASKMEEMRMMQAMYDHSYSQDDISRESIPQELYRREDEQRSYPQSQDEMLRTRLEILVDADKELEREEIDQARERKGGPSSRRINKDRVTKSKRSPPSQSFVRSTEESAFSQKAKKESAGGTNVTHATFPPPAKTGATQGTEWSEHREEPPSFKDDSINNRLNIIEKREDVKHHENAPNLIYGAGKGAAETYNNEKGTKRTYLEFGHHDKQKAKKNTLYSDNINDISEDPNDIKDKIEIFETSDSSLGRTSDNSSLGSATQPNAPQSSRTVNESETASIPPSLLRDHSLPPKLRMLMEYNKRKRQVPVRNPKETMQKMVQRVEREVNRRLALAAANVPEDNQRFNWLAMSQRGVSRAPTLDSIASVSQELIELFKSPSMANEDNEESESFEKIKPYKPSRTKPKGSLDSKEGSIASIETPFEYGFIDPGPSNAHEKKKQEKVESPRKRRNSTQEDASSLLNEKKRRTSKVESNVTETVKTVMRKQPAPPKTNLVEKYVQDRQKLKKKQQITKPGKQKDVAFSEIRPQEEKARKVTPGFPVDIWDSSDL